MLAFAPEAGSMNAMNNPPSQTFRTDAPFLSFVCLLRYVTMFGLTQDCRHVGNAAAGHLPRYAMLSSPCAFHSCFACMHAWAAYVSSRSIIYA